MAAPLIDLNNYIPNKWQNVLTHFSHPSTFLNPIFSRKVLAQVPKSILYTHQQWEVKSTGCVVCGHRKIWLPFSVVSGTVSPPPWSLSVSPFRSFIQQSEAKVVESYWSWSPSRQENNSIFTEINLDWRFEDQVEKVLDFFKRTCLFSCSWPCNYNPLYHNINNQQEDKEETFEHKQNKKIWFIAKFNFITMHYRVHQKTHL